MRLVTQSEARSLFGGRGSMLADLVERIASRRGAPVPIELPSVYGAGAELQAYSALFADWELEVADPAEVELKAPTTFPDWESLLDETSASWVADVLGAFCGSTTIAQQENMSFVASWAGAKDGASRVYYFHPNDWGLWPTDGSIACRLFRAVQEEDRPEHVHQRFEGPEEARLTSALKLYESVVDSDRLSPTQDPAAWHRRSEWLVNALTGFGRDPGSTLRAAAPVARFWEETALFSSHPHAALYWLWSHFFFGNRHELSVALSLSEGCSAELVQGTREWLFRQEAGRGGRLGPWEASQMQGLSERLSDLAPVQVFGPERRRDVTSRRSAAIEAKRTEEELRAPLEDAARTEPRVRQALVLLDHLARGGAVPPPPGPQGEDVVQAMENLANLVDPRFEPLLLYRLERAALHADGHHEAGWGLLMALASVCPDFSRFEGILSRMGTERFGPRRKAELYRAYGRFQDSRATERLLRASYRWLAEVDDWIRMEPVEAVEQLLERDTLETHQFIARLLQSASFSFANVSVCVKAAVAAGRLRSQIAVPGLRRAVQHRLGRIGDGGRYRVCVALHRVQGPDAADAFEAPIESALQAWEASEDEDEAMEHQQDLCCLLAGALPSRPEHDRWRRLAEALILELKVRLMPGRRPGPETLQAAQALVEGVRRAEDSGLARAIQQWPNLSRYPALRAARDQLAAEL